jgi:serine kinase of HPr protein (carbohydrate metabolism regulator)
MSSRSLSSETLHASCVARDGIAVLIAGPSGSGKSDLALRLIDRGARLVSDDYTIVRRAGQRLLAGPPPNIAGMLEVRGLGVLEFEWLGDVPVGLFVDLAAPVLRLPEEAESIVVAGVKLPTLAVKALEPSAPIKVELALDRLGSKT